MATNNENKCPDHPEKDNLYCSECIKRISAEAKADTAKQIDAILEEMEKEPHIEEGKEDSYDIGYLTALTRARTKIKEVFKVD